MKKIHLRGRGAYQVWLNGKELDPAPSQKVRNHSPCGFAWGYGGSGPAQLALAILLELTDQQTAEQRYQDFKRDIIAHLGQSDFEVEIDVSAYLELERQSI